MGITITDDVKLDNKTNLPVTATKVGSGGITITKEDLDKPINLQPVNVDPFDSINFTNIYTDDLSKYTKYNVPTTRYFNWDEQRAKNQGTGEKWMRGIAKGLVTTVGAVAENTLGVLAGLGEMAFGSGYYYDNFVGKTVDKANDWMRHTMPNYKTIAETNMPTGQKLGTANFWADTVLNGVGYSIGSIATMYLTGGTGLIMRGAKAGMFGANTAKVAGGITKAQQSKGIFDISKYITTGSQLAAQGVKGQKWTRRALNAAQFSELGFYMAAAEASVEAREAQKTAYADLMELEKERSGSVSPIQEQEILAASYAAGNTDFIVQLPVLAGTNLLMFGKQIVGFKTALKQNSDVALSKAVKQVVDKTAGKGLFRTALARLEPAARGAVTEAIQEGWQFASKTGAIAYHTDKYFNGGNADMSAAIVQGLSETFGTQEGLEAMLVGAIVGGGVSGVSSVVQKPYAQRQKNAQYLTALLDGGYLRNGANKLMNSEAALKALIDMEAAKQSKDIKAYKDAQNKLIIYNAFEALRNGGFDVFMEKLEEAKNMEEGEFMKSFGYDHNIGEGTTLQEREGKTQAELVDNLKEKLSKFSEIYENINDAFPSASLSKGLTRMRMSESKRAAEESVYNEREALRAQLIIGMAEINNRNSRLSSIHENMQNLLDTTVNLNNGSVMKDILALPNFGGSAIEEYDKTEEALNTFNRLKEIEQMLIKNKVDPLKIDEFNQQARDYMALLTQNQSAVDAYIKLSSNSYAQKAFEQERQVNEAEAKARKKSEEDKKNTEKAETTDDLKNDVKDPQGESKVDKEKKHKDLARQEEEAKHTYLDLHKDTSLENQIQMLKKTDTADLSAVELKGLTLAIAELEKKISTPSETFTDPDAQSIKDIIEQAPAENEDTGPAKREVINTDETSQLDIFAPQVEVVDEAGSKPLLGLELAENPTLWVENRKVGVDNDGNIVGLEPDTLDGKPIIINEDLLLGEVAGTEVEFVIIENDFFVENHKGQPTETEQIPIYVKIGDTIVGKLKASKSEERKTLVQKIRDNEQVNIDRQVDRGTRSRRAVNPNVKNKGPVAGKRYIVGNIVEVENEIKEDLEGGDYFVYTRINEFAEFDENGKQTKRAKVEVKGFKDKKTADKFIADQYEKVKKRAAEVIDTAQESKTAKKVTTKISEVFSTNANNAVLSEATSTRYFSDITDIIGNGNRNNVLLLLTTGQPGTSDIVQWEVSPVGEGKNQQDLDRIKNQTQREQKEGRLDQIAVVVRPENVPGGKPRVYILSTANLAESAKNEVINLIKERNYDKAAEIVASSQQRTGNNNPSFLEFNTFENGDKYMVYYSPKLRKLIRVTESEMTKALVNGPKIKVSFNTVTIENEKYKNLSKQNTEDLNFNLEEDFRLFLNTKKYHVDKERANSTDPYTSPVNSSNVYKDYQEYLFSQAEVGDRILGEGHNAILTIDAVKKGESLYNNPKVTFERGDIMGETKQEIIDRLDLTTMKNQVEPGSTEAPQGFMDKYNKKKCK